MNTLFTKINRGAMALLAVLLVSGLGCSQFTNSAADVAPEATEEPAAPGGSVSSKDLKIVNTVSWVRDGYLYIYAVVENHSDKWLKIAANITLYDKDGKELTSGASIGKALAPALPGNVAPGGWAILEHPEELSAIKGGEYDHFKFTSIKFEVEPASPEMQISNVQFTPETPYASFSGTLTNTGLTVCKDPMVMGIGYDADGKIFSTMWLTGDAEILGPDEKWEFHESLDNPNGEVKDVKVIAGCGAFHDQ